MESPRQDTDADDLLLTRAGALVSRCVKFREDSADTRALVLPFLSGVDKRPVLSILATSCCGERRLPRTSKERLSSRDSCQQRANDNLAYPANAERSVELDFSGRQFARFCSMLVCKTPNVVGRRDRSSRPFSKSSRCQDVDPTVRSLCGDRNSRRRLIRLMLRCGATASNKRCSRSSCARFA